MNSGKTEAIFTVDVEEYFHVKNLSSGYPRSSWGNQLSRVKENTQILLNMLQISGSKATFFILGIVAENHPELVLEIFREGHEIGSHGYYHDDVRTITKEDFRKDVRKSKEILERIINETVISYRAPSFSICSDTLWAIKILSEEGYRVDSSIFPVRRKAYGIPGAPVSPFVFPKNYGEIKEFPLSVCTILRYNIPIAGGGYFRLLPWNCFEYLADRREKTSKWPLIFYIHPWELDGTKPGRDAKFVSKFSKWKHFVGIDRTHWKINKLLSKYLFSPIRNYI